MSVWWDFLPYRLKFKIMTEEIQKRYQEIPNKLEFIKELAEELNKKPRSIQANWFSGFRIIPEKYQERVLTKLKNWKTL